MQGKISKIVKILGRMNSRTVMMERFQDAEFSWHYCPQKTVTIPRSVCVLYLLFTQPSLIRSFHSSNPCFSVSCPKGVGYARVYCIALHDTQTHVYIYTCSFYNVCTSVLAFIIGYIGLGVTTSVIYIYTCSESNFYFNLQQCSALEY